MCIPYICAVFNFVQLFLTLVWRVIYILIEQNAHTLCYVKKRGVRARPILKASSDGRATIYTASIYSIYIYNIYVYMYIMRKRTRVIIIPVTLFFLSQTTTKIKPAENEHRSTTMSRFNMSFRIQLYYYYYLF